MKFLILQKIKPPVPIEVLSKLSPAQLKYISELESKGIIEKYYHLIGQQGFMIICNVDSDDELSKIISQDPLFFYSSREIFPLTTRQIHTKHLMEILKGEI